ncbi:MAG: hypothetical protein ACJ73S_19015 [Mycobacteriales bacterium]
MPRATAVLLAGLLAAGCAAAGPGRPHPHTGLAADLDRLRADDGLYQASVPPAPGPDAATSGYALAVARLAGLAVAPVRVDTAAFADQRASEPLWTRYALAMVDRAAFTHLLTPADLAAVRSWQQPSGEFHDPAAPPEVAAGAAGRVMVTAAAVEALAEAGAPLAGDARRRALAALDRDATALATLPERENLRRARAALDAPAPPPATALRAWWHGAGRRLPARPVPDRVVEMAAFVQLAGRSPEFAGLVAAVRKRLAAVLPTLDDPQVGYLVAAAWRAAGGDRATLRPLARRLTTAPLASGLFPAPHRELGDLYATYLVERVRAGSGLPVRDRALVRALRAHRPPAADPFGLVLWVATLRAAGGRPAAGDVGAARAELRTQLGTPAGPVPPAARALLAELARQLGERPATVDTPAVEDPDATPLPDLAAASAVPGPRWPAGTRHRIAARLRALTGCPGTPHLVRSAPAAPCDIASTLAALRLRRAVQDG